MKRLKKIGCAAVLFLSVCFAPELRAQENLEKMIDKLMAGNTTTQIINYNGKDKSLPTYTAKITIFEKPLLDEFIAVFNRDKGSANLSVTQNKVTSAIFNKGGESHMYSYFVGNPSNGLVIYSRYKDMYPAKESIVKLTADSLRLELKYQNGFFNHTTKMAGIGYDKIFAAIPYRIESQGKIIITDGIDFIRSDKLSFGSRDKVAVKTDRKITILIPEGDFIYINGVKCTAEQARQKGLNVMTF